MPICFLILVLADYWDIYLSTLWGHCFHWQWTCNWPGSFSLSCDPEGYYRDVINMSGAKRCPIIVSVEINFSSFLPSTCFIESMHSNVGDHRVYEAQDQRFAFNPRIWPPSCSSFRLIRPPKLTGPQKGEHGRRERFEHGPGLAHQNLDSK